ncbi:MAG: hypothetical protein WCY00_02835 [Candidatus Dojkabacteria bacterium]
MANMIEKQPIRAVEGEVQSSDFSSIEDINPVRETVELAVPSPETFIPVPTAPSQSVKDEVVGASTKVSEGFPLSRESNSPVLEIMRGKINNEPVPSKY